jgi:hypothetical protein
MPAMKLFYPLLMALALTACAHAWPPEAHGGMAERGLSRDADIQNAADRIAYLQSTPNQRAPASLVEAEERMIRAQRESEGGLRTDADMSYLEAVDALRGGPDGNIGRRACPGNFCKAVK